MISSFLGFDFSGFPRKHFGDSIHLWGQPLVCAILKEILWGNQVCSSNGLISLQPLCTKDLHSNLNLQNQQLISRILWVYLMMAVCWRLEIAYEQVHTTVKQITSFQDTCDSFAFLQLFCDHLAWCSLCFECMQIQLKHKYCAFFFCLQFDDANCIAKCQETPNHQLCKSVLLASNEFQVGGKQNIDPNFPALKQLEFWKHFQLRVCN